MPGSVETQIETVNNSDGKATTVQRMITKTGWESSFAIATDIKLMPVAAVWDNARVITVTDALGMPVSAATTYPSNMLHH